MSGQHTPEPMFQYEFRQLATFEDGRTPILLTEEQYRRAKACVNACAGLDTDELERYGWSLITKLREDEANTFIKHRDELLAAASAVVERWDSPLWKDLPHTGEYIHRLREAIARVKGGAA